MRLVLFLLAALTLLPSPARAQAVLPVAFDLAQMGDAPPAEPRDPSEIVIVGRRLPGAVLGDILPLASHGPRDVAAFGAGTIGELVEALGPEARGAGGAPPAILVNGQRIAGFAEVRALPPEAVLRIDVLPEEAARRYGFGGDRRVVNIVLRPRFHAIAAEAGYGFATGGGLPSYEARATVSRIGEEGRWNVHARLSRAGALLESERRLEGGQGRLRTLTPRSDRLSLGGSFTRDVAREVAATATIGLEAGDTAARVGPAGGGAFLRRAARTRSANAGLSFGGPLGAWQWLFSGSLDGSSTVQATQLPEGAGLGEDRVRSRSILGEGRLLANGAALRLPAGDVHASLKLEGQWHRLSTRSRLAGSVEAERLSRREGAAEANLDVPLLGRGSQIGSLSASLTLGLGAVSGFGTLHEYGAGLRWSPAPWLSVAASAAIEEYAPNVHELGGAALRTPNVRVFDYVRGETADVERLDGGNPDLRAPRRGLARLGLVLRPLGGRNFALTADYSRSRLHDPIAVLPAPTPAVEAAFPGRFVRGGDGRLLRVDARPVNFDRADRDLMRWGVSLSKTLAAPAGQAETSPLTDLVGAPDRSGRLHLALFHSLHLRDRVRIHPGGAVLDFLRGAPGGSRPRHEIEAQAGLFRDGFGVRLEGRWASRMRVDAAATGGGSPYRLDHSSPLRLRLELFADLGERASLRARAPWTRGMRLSLAADNLLGARLRVRDANGETPRALQPAYLDPAGRTVRITLRKLF